MPYQVIDDLPKSVRHVLPEGAQEIYLASFNNAWKIHGDEPEEQRDTTCHKIAWTAVKRSYEKLENRWVLKTVR